MPGHGSGDEIQKLNKDLSEAEQTIKEMTSMLHQIIVLGGFSDEEMVVLRQLAQRNFVDAQLRQQDVCVGVVSLMNKGMLQLAEGEQGRYKATLSLKLVMDRVRGVRQ